MPQPDDDDDDESHAAASARVSTRRRRRRWLVTVVVGAALCSIGAATYLGVLIVTTPGVDELRQASTARPSVILSADGEVIGRFARAYQAPVALSEVAPAVVQALIATEDHRFYQHHGIDPARIVASAWRTVQGDLQGASTLTQQLARNLFPEAIGSSRNLNRKLREAITAVRLEQHSSKQEILEAYLNSAPFLYNVRGFEMAARTYFGRSASELDVAQAATLVGMLKGSHRYNPVRHPERARERRNVVLAQMLRRGVLGREAYDELRARPLALNFSRPEDGDIGQARHFVEHIRERLVEWADVHDHDLDRDGLVIQTTLDSQLQRLAQQAVVQQVAQLQQIAGREWSEPRLQPARLNQAPVKQPFAQFWRANPALLSEIVRGSPEYRSALVASGDPARAQAQVLADPVVMARLAEGLGSAVGDARRAEQVLLNLLANAVKFTEHGSVTLAAETVGAAGAGGGAAVCLRVIDTGRGIRAEDLPRLFRPFEQLEAGIGRAHEGTGLGLAISRRLAELMGGRIDVQSRWQQGSEFTFTLPRDGGAHA